MTGLSRAQITHLITMYLEGDPVEPNGDVAGLLNKLLIEQTKARRAV